MKGLFWFSLSAFGAVTLANLAGAVEAPPQQLLGKSIVVTWSESRIQRDEGEANFKPVHATQKMSLYIGATGRVFSRLTYTTRRGSGRFEQVQENSAAAPKSSDRTATFGDQSMTVVQPFQQGGMRRLLINFGDDFDNCSAKVSYVTEPGSQTSSGWSAITKKMVEFKSIRMSGENCSVLGRNVFGGE